MIIKNKAILIVVILGVFSMLAGCASKQAPDEFMVLRNPQLVLPPDFYLTPGGRDSDLDEVIDPQVIAKRALFGEN